MTFGAAVLLATSQVLALEPLPPVAQDTSNVKPPIALSEVWASVERHHPDLTVAQLKVAAARGKELAARGGFDLYVKAGASGDPLGKFAKRTNRIELEQGLPWVGAEVFGGYRNGFDFPVYHGEEITSDAGELRLGASLRLLRDRAIDETRMNIRNSRLLSEVSLRALDLRRLEVRLAAAQTYLKWVAAGLKNNLAKRLLALAEHRQGAMREQVRNGAMARIDAVENELLIFSRQERSVSSEQALTQAALDLSLYLRNAEGRPTVPDNDRLLSDLKDVVTVEAGVPLEQALAQRMDLQALQLDIERARIEVSGARNQLLPRLDVKAVASRDVGTPRPYAPFAQTTNENQIGLAVTLSLPVQMRKARGELEQRNAELEALQTQAAFLRDRIAVQIQQAQTMMAATARRMELSEQLASAARQLENAERMRLEAGQSSLLVVNLRELASADAQARVIDSWAEHQLALVSYQAALGKL